VERDPTGTMVHGRSDTGEHTHNVRYIIIATSFQRPLNKIVSINAENLVKIGQVFS